MNNDSPVDMLHSRIFTFNPLGTNCVVLWEDGQKACTVVDPGMSSADGARDLFDYFERQGLTPDAILLTHGHFDHFWGVEKLLARYQVPVYLHPEDKEVMDNVSGTPGITGSFSFLRHDFPTVDVADGEVLTTAGTAWKVIHTPGHAFAQIIGSIRGTEQIAVGIQFFRRDRQHGACFFECVCDVLGAAAIQGKRFILIGLAVLSKSHCLVLRELGFRFFLR